MYNNSSLPMLAEMTFNNNDAYTNGGGMYNNSSNPKLLDITFSNNSGVAGRDGKQQQQPQLSQT